MSERFSDEVLQRVYQAAAIAASEAHAEFATPEDTTARAIAAMRAVLEGHENARVARLEEALAAIHTSTREDEKGQQWEIRKYLDAHGVCNDDIAGSRRLVAEACKVA